MAEAPETYQPKNLYLSGPAPMVAQEAVVVGEYQARLTPVNGRYTVASAAQEDALRRALPRRLYDEDGPLRHCPHCNWTVPSADAMLAHMRLHPVTR